MNEDLLIKLAYDVLAILVPALVALAIELLRRRLGVEKMKNIDQELQTKQELSKSAVAFAQQFYQSKNGHERYIEASKWLSERLDEKGIRVADDEIRGLIESALRSFKDQFGEEWGKVVDDESEDEEAG